MKLKGYRTILFNVLSILIAVAGVLLQYIGMLGLDPLLVAKVSIALALVVNVGNIVLRFKTDTAVGQSQ